MIDFDAYEKVYKQQLKRMTNEQVISLLVNNVRNQEKKTKRYGMSKKQLAHVEKLSVNIMILREELLNRMEEEVQ